MALSSTIATVLLILFLLFSGCFGTYQYFTHVQQWGPAVLKKFNRDQFPMFPDKLTIHGLWPTNWTDPQPRNCPPRSITGRYYNSGDKITPTLIEALDKSWPSYLVSNELFWGSQWTTHGTCSFHIFKQTRYFWLSHNIWERFNLFGLLEQGGIVPVDDKRKPIVIYRREDVISAINVYHNVVLEVEIDCIEGTIELLEIKICLNHDGLSYINCTRIGSCGKFFKWLKYSKTNKKKQPVCESSDSSTEIDRKISNTSLVYDTIGFGDIRDGNIRFGFY